MHRLIAFTAAFLFHVAATSQIITNDGLPGIYTLQAASCPQCTDPPLKVVVTVTDREYDNRTATFTGLGFTEPLVTIGDWRFTIVAGQPLPLNAYGGLNNNITTPLSSLTPVTPPGSPPTVSCRGWSFAWDGPGQMWRFAAAASDDPSDSACFSSEAVRLSWAGNDVTVAFAPAGTVPEPGSAALLLAGLLSVAYRLLRQRG